MTAASHCGAECGTRNVFVFRRVVNVSWTFVSETKLNAIAADWTGIDNQLDGIRQSVSLALGFGTMNLPNESECLIASHDSSRKVGKHV